MQLQEGRSSESALLCVNIILESTNEPGQEDEPTRSSENLDAAEALCYTKTGTDATHPVDKARDTEHTTHTQHARHL
jgi:hypothetical protein